MSRIHQSFFFLYLNKYYRKFQFLIYNFQEYGLYIYLWSPKIGAFFDISKWFRGLVGYGICLTRITSPVRSWAESIFSFLVLVTSHGDVLLIMVNCCLLFLIKIERVLMLLTWFYFFFFFSFLGRRFNADHVTSCFKVLRVVRDTNN